LGGFYRPWAKCPKCPWMGTWGPCGLNGAVSTCIHWGKWELRKITARKVRYLGTFK